MQFVKNLSGIVIAMLLLFDAVIAYRLLDLGWPKYVRVGSGDTLQVVRVPFTWEDALIGIGIAVIHVLVIYVFRKSRVAPGSPS